MIFIIKGLLEKNVPIISQIRIAINKGMPTKVICTNCDERTNLMLTELGVTILCTNHKTIGPSYVKKISDWSLFRINAKRLLKRISTPDEIIYIGSVDTAIAYGKSLLKYNYIFHIRELYDKFPNYLIGMKKYAQNAKCVVVPEYCRANILKSWLKLDKLPLVIPNKPFNHPMKRGLDITDEKAEDIIRAVRNKKIFLYQGLLDEDRNMDAIAQALSKLNNDEYILMLMGKENPIMIEQLKNIYPNTYHINYVPAPFHLEITSHAHVGIVNYDDSSLNNIFCAPNKIFEYSGFGIPILGCNIPGLKYTIDYSNAGICVSFDDVETIIKSIEKIEKNYDYYSMNSLKFFNSIDLSEMFDEMINR